MKVIVTRKHIMNGHPGNKYSCPIARAIRDALNDEDTVCVDFSVVYFGQQTSGLPEKARWFIRLFDGLPFLRRLLPQFSFDLHYARWTPQPHDIGGCGE